MEKEDILKYFDDVRSLWRYRDEKLKVKRVKKSKVERDEDDQELFARAGFETQRTKYSHLYRIRRKLYESSQVSDKRERYLWKILERSSKLERKRSSLSKSCRRRVPVASKRRAFLLPSLSAVSKSRTSTDAHDAWRGAIWEPFSVCLDDLPAQILDSDEMTIHHLGLLGRASIATGSTLPLIVAARVLLTWRSRNIDDSIVVHGESSTRKEESKDDHNVVKEENSTTTTTTSEESKDDHIVVKEENSTTTTTTTPEESKENLEKIEEEEASLVEIIDDNTRNEKQIPSLCCADIHMTIQILQTLPLFPAKTTTKNDNKRSDNVITANIWNSIERHIKFQSEEANAALDNIAKLCGYPRGLVACALRATNGDGNAAFMFLQEHATSMSMFVSGWMKESNEKLDEETCVLMSVTGKSEIACRGACGIGSANRAIGWLMDNHDTVLRDSGLLDALGSVKKIKASTKNSRSNNNGTIGTMSAAISFEDKTSSCVENLIRILLRCIQDSSDVLTSCAESVQMLLSFTRDSMFQHHDKDILNNTLRTCLSNLQEGESLSLKIWKDLESFGEKNLILVEALTRSSLEILENILENVSEDTIILNVIDAITRRPDFHLRPLINVCTNSKTKKKSLIDRVLPLIVTKCLERKIQASSDELVALVRLSKQCNSPMLSFAIATMVSEFVVSTMESEPLSDLEMDMSIWIDLFREKKDEEHSKMFIVEDLETCFGPDKTRSRGVFPKQERALLRALSCDVSKKSAWRAVVRLRARLRQERSAFKSGTSTRLDMKRHEQRLWEAIEKKDKEMTRLLLHGRQSRDTRLNVASDFETYLNQVYDRLDAVSDLSSPQVLNFALSGDLIPSSKYVRKVVETRRRRGIARLKAMRTLRDCLREDTNETWILLHGVFESLSRGIMDEDEDVDPWVRVCHIRNNILLKDSNELNTIFREIVMIVSKTVPSSWFLGLLEWNDDDKETVSELVCHISSPSSSSSSSSISLIRALTAYACVQDDSGSEGGGRRGILIRRLKSESPFLVPKHNANERKWLRELLYQQYVRNHDLSYARCLILMRLNVVISNSEKKRLFNVLFDEKNMVRFRRAALRLLVVVYDGENLKHILGYIGHVVKCTKGYSVDLASDMVGLVRKYLERNQGKWKVLLEGDKKEEDETKEDETKEETKKVDDTQELGAIAVAGGWNPILCEGGHVTRENINTRSIVVHARKGTKKCDILSGGVHVVSMKRSKLRPLDVVSTPTSTEWLRTSLLKHVNRLMISSSDKKYEQVVSRMLATWCEHAETAKCLKKTVLKHVLRLATRPIPGAREDSMIRPHILARRMNAIRRLLTNKSCKRILVRDIKENTNDIDKKKDLMTTLLEQRSGRAKDLSDALGHELRLCEKALELNRDDPDRAAEWLMIHSDTFVRGGGMREEAPPKGIYVGDAKRWSLARDLALTAGMPPLLCAKALQVFSDRADSAMVWLLDRGSSHREDILNPDRIDFRKLHDKDSCWDWVRSDQNDEDDMGEGRDEDDEDDEEEYGDILLREMMRLMGLPPISAHQARQYVRPRLSHQPIGMSLPLSSMTSSSTMMTPSRRNSRNTKKSTQQSMHGRRRSMRLMEELKTSQVRGRPEVSLLHLDPRSARPGDLVVILEKRKHYHEEEKIDDEKDNDEGIGKDEERKVESDDDEVDDDNMKKSIKKLSSISWLTNVRSGALIEVSKKICTIENYGVVRLRNCFRVESYFGSHDVVELTKQTKHALSIIHLRRAAILMLNSSSSSYTRSNAVPASQLLELIKYLFAKGDYDVSSKLAMSLDPSVAAGDGVRQLLVCTEDVKQSESTSVGGTIVVDSVHPHLISNEPLEYSGHVQVAGARALKLEFDSRCELTHRSRLEIRNSSGDLVRAFVGSRYADSFRWTFTSLPTSSSAWGYRFRVSSVRNVIWKTERSIAQNNASLQFACWLLDLMLDKAEDIYNSNVVTALVRYMKVPDMPFKVNVVRTLIRLLWSWNRFSSEARMALRPLVATLRDEAYEQNGTPLVSELAAVCRVFCCDEKFASAPLRRTFSSGFFGMKTKQGVKPAIRKLKNKLSAAAVVTYPLSDLIRLGVALRDGLRIPDDLAMLTWWGKKSDTKSVEPLVLAMSRWKREDDMLLLKTKKTSDTVSRFRLGLVELLNRRLLSVARNMRDDLDSPTRHLIQRGIPYLVMSETKNNLVRDLVESSTHKRLGDARLTVVLDNRRVFQSAERGNVAAETSQCIFAQVFAQLNLVSDTWLRTELDSKGRIWITHFAGEEGVDHGGLFRSTLTSCVQDLFSKRSIDLFVESARTRNFVPNPAKRESAIARRMFTFVGKLLGVSIRIRADLPFCFDDFVWTRILSLDENDLSVNDEEAHRLNDLTRLDPSYVDEIQEYSSSSSSSQREKTFFTAKRSTGEEFELLSGGKYISVTKENHHEYVRLCVKHRLDEYVDSIRLIREGLLKTVPRRMLTFLGPQDLKRFACGEPTIDVSTWRSNSTYVSCSRTSEFSRRFWRVLGSMNQEQRSKLLYFTWGRTRLPAQGSKDWKPFRLTRCQGGDDRLPVGHTCFFQLEMPDYSSEAVMRTRLLTALEYSGGEFLIR